MRTEQGWGTALLRIVVGVLFIAHGHNAYATTTPAGTAALIRAMGYPAALSDVLAWYLIAAHLAGGVLLVIGLWTRAAAIAQLPIVASAVFLLHWDHGFLTRGVVVDATAGRAIAVGYEFPLLMLTATLALVLLGPGALSFETTRDRHALEARSR